MNGEKASHLFHKLRPFLRKIEGRGYYPPVRNSLQPKTRWHDEEWHLVVKAPGVLPTWWVTWNPKRQGGKPLTFSEFLSIYNITCQETA